jgi:hypothetical protein
VAADLHVDRVPGDHRFGGWAMELIANHSLTNRLITASWGAMFDA